MEDIMETKKRIENANANEETKILSSFEPGDDFDLTLDNNFKPNTYIDNSTTTSVTFEIRNNIQQPWKELKMCDKCKSGTKALFRCLGFMSAFYLFICSLALIESAFELLGGRAAGEVFRKNEVLSNPLAGLMIGVLATVMVQSSSTATSIIVTLVASQVIPLQTAIPVIMGSNIGTTITNTFVALAQAGNRKQFRRAFAGATVHDVFNWLSVLVLLPLEMSTHYLYHLSDAIVTAMDVNWKSHQIEILTAITKPFTNIIVQVNSDAISDSVIQNSTEQSVLKRWCGSESAVSNKSFLHFFPANIRCSEEGKDSLFYDACLLAANSQQTIVAISVNITRPTNVTVNDVRCKHLFALTDMSDSAVGSVLLALALITTVVSLFTIVKLLAAVFRGHFAKLIAKTINTDLPGRAACLTGYLAMLLGAGLTVVIQSSSVFTSILTPLVGMGIVSVERMYPLTLGANIGTTMTGFLAALSTRGRYMRQALQVALCHLLFNISGMLLFYPIPCLRVPVPLAKTLSRKTAEYRWFAIVYLVVVFLLLPVGVFALSYAGRELLLGVTIPLLLLFFFVCVVNVLQVKRQRWLPPSLRTWDFLPSFLHSLRPWDSALKSCFRLNDLETSGLQCRVDKKEDAEDGQRKTI